MRTILNACWALEISLRWERYSSTAVKPAVAQLTLQSDSDSIFQIGAKAKEGPDDHTSDGLAVGSTRKAVGRRTVAQ